MWAKHNYLIYEKDICSACSGVLYTLQISLCEHLNCSCYQSWWMFKFSTYCLFLPLKSSCNIQFNFFNNSMFKVQQNSINLIHMGLDRYWIIQYSKLSDLGCIWEVFYLDISFICRFRVIRVPICVFWSLHSWINCRYRRQRVRRYHNSYCMDTLGGLSYHVTVICLFHIWSLFSG